MKQLSMIGAAALLVNSALVPAAWADTIPTVNPAPADSVTLDAMQDQCDTLAANHEAGNEDHWSAEVKPGAVTWVSGPTEDASTRDIDESTRVGIPGTFVPADIYIKGDPFRIGGSVNMFGDQWARAGYFTDSTYYYDADFVSHYSHAFSCDIYRAPIIPGDPNGGYYKTYDDGNGADEDAIRANCAQYTDHTQPWWGQQYFPSDKIRHCEFVSEPTEDTWGTPAFYANEAGTPIDQEQTDNLRAFEDHGGLYEPEGGEYHVGQVVICISPSTTTKKGVPGAWVAKNGYETVTPTKCTTAWFNDPTIKWGAGTESSNGTYISVPAT